MLPFERGAEPQQDHQAAGIKVAFSGPAQWFSSVIVGFFGASEFDHKSIKQDKTLRRQGIANGRPSLTPLSRSAAPIHLIDPPSASRVPATSIMPPRFLASERKEDARANSKSPAMPTNKSATAS